MRIRLQIERLVASVSHAYCEADRRACSGPNWGKDMLLSGAAQAESRTESPGDEFMEPVPMMFCWITTIL